MCENVKATLEILKQKKSNLTKGEIVVVFQQVVNDLNKQGERMTNIERRMESLEAKMDAGFAEIKRLIENEQKATFWSKIPLLKEIPLPVWLILWTVVTAIFCLLGVNPSFLQYIKGG